MLTSFLRILQGYKFRDLKMLKLRDRLLRNGSDYQAIRSLCEIFAARNLVREAYNAAKLLPKAELRECAQYLRPVTEIPEKMAAVIELITKCNLKCPICFHGQYYNTTYDKLNEVMSFDNFKIIWGKISARVSLADFVGQGETFLHPDIYRILDYTGNVPLHIDTNGTIPINADRIVGDRPSTLIFSVDGVDQRTYALYRINGSFDKVVENIKNIVNVKREKAANYPKIIFKYILFKHNEMYLPQARELAKELGVDDFRLESCISRSSLPIEITKKYLPCGKNSKHRVAYIDYGNQRTIPPAGADGAYCSNFLKTFSVLVDGSVGPCCANVFERRLGNLFCQSFEEIWMSPEYVQFRETAISNCYNDIACRDCTLPRRKALKRIFDNTALAYPSPPPASRNVLVPLELAIDENYADYLRQEGLTNELNYFIKSGKYKS